MTEEDVAVEAAEAAAAILASTPLSGVRHKGAVDLVTALDLVCEEAIRRVLARHTPDIPILGEEGGGQPAPTRWVVDPVDGTTNLVHGIPHYAVSIGLVVDGEPTVGVVHHAPVGHTLRATRGHGATCEGVRLQVSNTRELSQALLATGFPYDRQDRSEFYLRAVRRALENAQGLRRMGAAALDLAFVAQGRFDGYWEYGLAPWDVAGGIVLVREAGGIVTAIPGHGLDAPACPIASNGWVHDALVALIGWT